MHANVSVVRIMFVTMEQSMCYYSDRFFYYVQ